MDPITMTLEQTKSTKGTTVFQEVTDDAEQRGHTFYLLKSIEPNPPATIQITISDPEADGFLVTTEN